MFFRYSSRKTRSIPTNQNGLVQIAHHIVGSKMLGKFVEKVVLILLYKHFNEHVWWFSIWLPLYKRYK